jgi:murein DD-endopeptidase MepM/ murein hydrolase activator NlpD
VSVGDPHGVCGSGGDEERAGEDDEGVHPGRALRRALGRAAGPASLAAAVLLVPVAASAPDAAAASAPNATAADRDFALLLSRAAPSEPPTLSWPSAAPVGSEFAARWGRMHTGLDLDGDTGDPVLAAADGVVASAEYDGAYGLTVVIVHTGRLRGLASAYAHLSGARVAPGARVARGELIGRMGISGNATGDHLHFEIRRNGRPLDPRTLLERRRVVLSPRP